MKVFKYSVLILLLLGIAAAIYAGIKIQSDQSSKNSSAAINEQPYKVGAYYFGTFGPDNPVPKMDRIEETYGRRDWWGGVKDFYGQEPGITKDTRGWSGDFSHLKPVLGYYDLSDVSIVEKQIMQARQNGLSYFSFYWYWNSLEDREFMADGINSFLAARNTTDLEFMISIVSDVEIFSIPNDKFDYVINLICEKYFQKSNYLKINGRPVIFLLDTRGIGAGNASDTVAFIDKFKNIAFQKYGVSPYFLINMELSYSKQVTNADGYSCLNFYGINQSYSQSYINQIISKFNNFSDKPLFACAMQNFDERPRQDIERERSEIRYFTDFSIDKFVLALQKTKNYMDSKNNIFSKYITIYAWNEWHEGGVIEPNVKDKSIYLNKIAEAFNLNVGEDPCRITGDCKPYEDTTGSTIKGIFEGITNQGKLYGWVFDTSTPSASIKIQIYVGGEYNKGGTLIDSIDANIVRNDPITNRVGTQGNHGFEYQLPERYLDGNEYLFYIYGINIENTPGYNSLISINPRSFKLGRDRSNIINHSTVIGSFEKITSDGKLIGWAVDSDNYSKSIDVHIYVGSEAGKGGILVNGVQANLTRSDINTNLKITGNHGFEFQLPEKYLDGGKYVFYVYGINIEGTAGYNYLLGLNPKEYFLTKVETCKSLDINSDQMLSLVDLTALLSVYRTSCTDNGTYSSCGSQDTNMDGEISLVDLAYLLSKYKISDCSK